MESVTMRDVVKDYGSVRAVDHLDLVIESGRITTILGRNGAGKTTAIDMMLGLRRPTQGTIEVLGMAPDDPRVRANVGAMLQEPGFPGATTGAELLSLVAAASPAPLPVGEVLELADLAGLGGSRISQLSGGQRQRLAFGLAMVGNPAVLFLDEPTVALDVESRRRFWVAIRELADRDRTVVFTTHYLAEADEIADRVVVIDAGRLVTDGTPSSIRAVVGGRTVRFTTSLSATALRGLPGVDHVDLDAFDDLPVGTPRRVAVHTVDVDAVVTALVRDRHDLTDLTIEEAALEDAFLRLTSAA